MKKVIKDIFEIDIQYLENLHNLHSHFPFFLARIKIKTVKKLVANIHDNTEYVIHELVLKKIHRVVKFNQKVWLKLYIDMNTELRKKAKYDFEKNLFKFMNNSVFGRTMKIFQKYRDIKLVTTEEKNNLVSKPNFHTTKFFTEHLLAIKMRNTKKS